MTPEPPPLSTEQALALARAYLAVVHRHPDGSLDQVFAAFEQLVPNLFDRMVASLLAAAEDTVSASRLADRLKRRCREEIAQSRVLVREDRETEWHDGWEGAFELVIREIDKLG